MPTTSNFGWTTPADTDLVKDGAAAIRTLGNGIDTSFLDLKGGTTGQNLRKASNTDLDFTFAGDATNTVVDAEGDLLVGDSADTLQRLAIGTTGQVLTVDTTLDGKIKWAAPATPVSGLTLITSSTFTTVSSHSIDNCFTSNYANYLIMITFTDGSTTTSQNLTIKFRASGSDTSSGYKTNQYVQTGTYTDPTEDRQGTDELFVGVYQGNEAKKCAVGAYIYAPQLSQPTMLTGTSTYKDQYNVGQWFVQGLLDNSTAYDGLTLIVSSGTMNGTVRIYGIQNS